MASWDLVFSSRWRAFAFSISRRAHAWCAAPSCSDRPAASSSRRSILLRSCSASSECSLPDRMACSSASRFVSSIWPRSEAIACCVSFSLSFHASLSCRIVSSSCDRSFVNLASSAFITSISAFARCRSVSAPMSFCHCCSACCLSSRRSSSNAPRSLRSSSCLAWSIFARSSTHASLTRNSEASSSAALRPLTALSNFSDRSCTWAARSSAVFCCCVVLMWFTVCSMDCLRLFKSWRECCLIFWSSSVMVCATSVRIWSIRFICSSRIVPRVSSADSRVSKRLFRSSISFRSRERCSCSSSWLAVTLSCRIRMHSDCRCFICSSVLVPRGCAATAARAVAGCLSAIRCAKRRVFAVSSRSLASGPMFATKSVLPLPPMQSRRSDSRDDRESRPAVASVSRLDRTAALRGVAASPVSEPARSASTSLPRSTAASADPGWSARLSMESVSTQCAAAAFTPSGPRSRASRRRCPARRDSHSSSGLRMGTFLSPSHMAASGFSKSCFTSSGVPSSDSRSKSSSVEPAPGHTSTKEASTEKTSPCTERSRMNSKIRVATRCATPASCGSGDRAASGGPNIVCVFPAPVTP
mmetsp:Transcript_32670/g.98751  ORF Transcript_32670/g.98751 Transcript_32670/m.98751 type:complete len:586 (+) Transcript_32670:322-2079(+)